MTNTIDKVIILNRKAMTDKYGQAGTSKIERALKELIKFDKSRNITTMTVAIDSPQEMVPYTGTAVVNAADQRQAKQAIDAVSNKIEPPYILLLDGPDVIPHIDLSRIDGLTDDDEMIESDLPYASAAPFSRSASSYMAVTRVVSRLPAARGNTSSDGLTGLIDHICSFKMRDPSDYENFFGMSADVWKQSTQLSLTNIFGNAKGMKVSPKDAHDGINSDLGRLVHFVNCHGGSGDPAFYGQRGQAYPKAMESSRVAPHVKHGTIAAVECCYGAQLYDNTLIGNDPPICMSYLAKGCIGFFGSTTIAYGPAASNGQADLMAQYFLEAVLNGGSLGASVLKARQQFISSQSMADPTNLKTLAQFLLLGDPSLVAVDTTKHAKGAPTRRSATMTAATPPGVDTKSGRLQRRVAMKGNGLAVASSASKLGKPVAASTDELTRLTQLSAERGFSAKPAVFSVTGGTAYRSAAKTKDMDRKLAVVSERRATKRQTKDGPASSFHVMIAHIINGKIAKLDECESR